MQRFFYPTPKESFPLLEKVIEDNSLISESNVSSPYNINNRTLKAVDVTLYGRIQCCLSLLKEAKKNLISYRTMEQRRQKIVLAINLICLLTEPAILGTLMLKIHLDLAVNILSKLELLKKNAKPIIQNRDAFMNWYNSKISLLNQAILYKYQRCDDEERRYRHANHIQEDVNYFWNSNDCRGKKLAERETPYRYFPDGASVYFYDFCTMNQTRFSVEKCNQILDSFCESDARILNCVDEEMQDKKEFISQQSSYLSTLNDKYQNTLAPIHALEAKSTWESLSTTSFIVASITCSGLALYLYKSWCNARKEYEEDLKKIQIRPQDLPHLINLADILKISLKEVTHDELVAQLEKLAALEKPRREARIAFFHAAHQHGLPQEVSKLILEKADMIAFPKVI